MPPSNRTTYDQLWEAAVERLPEFSPAEQRAGQALLALLTQGEPVSAAQLASALGIQAENPESGRQWTESHPDTVLLTLDEAFAFGRRQNRRMFGAELAKRASHIS